MAPNREMPSVFMKDDPAPLPARWHILSRHTALPSVGGHNLTGAYAMLSSQRSDPHTC
jgi:hypothetical protein